MSVVPSSSGLTDLQKMCRGLTIQCLITIRIMLKQILALPGNQCSYLVITSFIEVAHYKLKYYVQLIMITQWYL